MTDEKIKEILKKHKPKSWADIQRQIKEMQKAKQKYTRDAKKLEVNIMNFVNRLEPLVDPATDEVLCWVRNPTRAEWDEMVPREYFEYENPEDMPPEVREKLDNHVYEMMAKLIAIPKHDAKWWREHTNIPFVMLFQAHLMKQYELLGIDVENF